MPDVHEAPIANAIVEIMLIVSYKTRKLLQSSAGLWPWVRIKIRGESKDQS
jgi:hypothetical protein